MNSTRGGRPTLAPPTKVANKFGLPHLPARPAMFFVGGASGPTFQCERTCLFCRHGLKCGFHGPPLGTQLACKTLLPALVGKSGFDLPWLPPEIVTRILEWVIVVNYEEYRDGPTGMRARQICGGAKGRQLVGKIGVPNMSMLCEWCSRTAKDAFQCSHS